ncbi:unnamed protein product [Echinostoma caproni]|uniref:Zinc finger protein n=1 Tax=Echinostoma caproni TaxID=27848 RepID=A0A183B6H6_9TREM|nr:unnamed protein product [Echinostoma caproni]
MLHRPTLIPNTMRTTYKTSRSSLVSESALSPLINTEEIVVVEPTDPDEDRLKELQQQMQLKQSTVTHSNISNTEPVKSNVETAAVPTDVDITTHNSTTTSTNIPLSEALHSLLSAAVRSCVSISNGSIPSSVSSKLTPNDTESTRTLFSDDSTVSSKPTSGISDTSSPSSLLNMTPIAATRTIGNATESLHPLVAALLVNCATVNLITQHVRSLGMPVYVSPSPGQSSALSCHNLTNIISTCLSKLPTESRPPQRVESAHQTNSSTSNTETNISDSTSYMDKIKHNNGLVSHKMINRATNPPTLITNTNKNTRSTSTSGVKTTTETDRASMVVQSLLDEARTAIEASKDSAVSASKTPNRVKRFKCPIPNCSLAFYSRFNQTEHIRTHTGERPFLCTIPSCSAAFKRRRDLRDHLNVHTVCEIRKTVRTVKPDTSSPQPSDPLPDITLSTEKTVIKCEQTNCDLGNEIAMELDKLADDAPLIYPSHKCSGSPLGKGDSIDSVQCKPSNEDLVLRKSSSEKKHPVTSGTPQTTVRRHACPYANCDKAYAKLNKLKEHLRSHTGERPYVCREPGCGAAFIRLYGVRRHELTHVFNRKGGSRFAKKLNHFSNAKGPVVSEDSNHDQSEYSSTHSSSGMSVPFISPLSNIRSLIKDAEASAVPWDNEKNFCPVGNNPDSSHSSFLTTTTTTQSTRSLPVIAPKVTAQLIPRPLSPISGRPGIRRPHLCPFKDCGKAFPKTNKLREHIYRHTGERPYACEKCSASFVRMYDLRRHSKIHLRILDARRGSLPLAPKQQQKCTSNSSAMIKPEPDSTLLC